MVVSGVVIAVVFVEVVKALVIVIVVVRSNSNVITVVL